MKKGKGKLITVWVPGNHGAGGSTIADGIGIILQYFISLQTVIVNFSGRYSYMERFFENEIDICYTMDYLKSFGCNINIQQLKTFATQINNRLSIIPGTRFGSDYSVRDMEFYDKVLERCLDAYDIVIADIVTGVKNENKALLDKADIIVAVMTPNEIMLDDIFSETGTIPICNYLTDRRTVPVFNMMSSKNTRDLRRLSGKYGFDCCFGLDFDGMLFEACCRNRKLYTYIVSNLERGTSGFVEQMDELCTMLSERLGIDCYRKIRKTGGLLDWVRNITQVVKNDERVLT
ncbi:MAG: hypothetical protein ACOZCL_05765 [Bacillota bacterium]